MARRLKEYRVTVAEAGGEQVYIRSDVWTVAQTLEDVKYEFDQYDASSAYWIKKIEFIWSDK